ncbi:MAG: hypothetical protein HYU64_05030 [Armatimonadetes bacterium]|nr:hypothetical protein [Armatimonadota bacterium]
MTPAALRRPLREFVLDTRLLTTYNERNRKGRLEKLRPMRDFSGPQGNNMFMRVSRFTLFSVAVALFSILWIHPGAALAADPADPGGESRRVGTYWYFISEVSGKTGKPGVGAEVLLWIALPINRPGQKVRITSMVPAPSEILKDPDGGNEVAFWRIKDPPVGEGLVFRYDFEVVNRTVTFDVDPARVSRPPLDSREYVRYTISEPWLEITPEIASLARRIVGKEENPYLQGRLVFDWVVENITYDYPDVKERGVKRAFAERRGDCGEFSHIFIAMMRSLGVPCRSVTCNWYQGAGHAWAEMFIPPYGWIPVDTSGAQLVKNGLRGQLSGEQVRGFMTTRGIATRDPYFLFGNLYPHRLEVFIGENVKIESKGTGITRTFQFMQPGGSSAWPPAIEMPGISEKTTHVGFFLFGEGSGDETVAREIAEEEMVPAYLTTGQYEKALPILSRALMKDPSNSMKLFRLGLAYFHLKLYHKAVEALKGAIEGKGGGLKRTTDTWAHILSGMCHDIFRDRERALLEYARALEIGADHNGSLATARKLLESPYEPED